MTHLRIFAGIFLFSFSSLSYEIALTRIFSISLWYHFAFMVISIAMLGIGASGTALSLFPKLKVPSRIGIYGLLLGGSITLSYLSANRIPFDPVRLSWDRVQILYICLYYLLLSSPFFFLGLCVATAFSTISESSGLLYGSDLLGAGTGSLCLLYFMSVMSPEEAVILVSSIALAGAFLTGAGRTRIFSFLLLVLNASLLATPDNISPRMSPYKGLQLALKYPGAEHIKTYYNPFSRIDIFKSPAVRFAPGLSLKYLDALPEQIGLSIDGGDINAVTRGENKESLRFLEYLPSALPYTLSNKDDVLILEPKGGLEVLLAGYFDSKNIDKVDPNPLLIRVMRNDFGEFAPAIYDENTWTGIGRSWLKRRTDKFDVIDIPLTGTSPSGSGAFGMSEDYRFTVEAFKEYLRHLKHGGILSIHLFILPPPRMDLRLLSTIATAMEEIGSTEIRNRIISIRSWDTICILAKSEPFTPEEIGAVRKFSGERRFDLVYLPGIKEEETNIFVRMPSNEYFTSFTRIINPQTRESFHRDYLFDVTPVRDENPFFHYFLRLDNIKAIYHTMGGKWQFFIEEGYLLPVVFLQVLLLSTVLILLPAFSKKNRANIVIARNKVTKQSQSEIVPDDKIASAKPRNDIIMISLLYFAFLGLGFMFVEISLIQKMILPLENPPYAIAAVLTTILISSGTGSLLSYRFPVLRSPSILPLIALLIAVYSLLLPAISDAIAPYAMSYKIMFAFFLIAPLAFLMGVPFPVGMKNLGEILPDLIPWAWAINGSLSVLAPVVTIMLAMVIGFRAVLWIGAGAYLLAYLTFPKA